MIRKYKKECLSRFEIYLDTVLTIHLKKGFFSILNPTFSVSSPSVSSLFFLECQGSFLNRDRNFDDRFVWDNAAAISTEMSKVGPWATRTDQGWGQVDISLSSSSRLQRRPCRPYPTSQPWRAASSAVSNHGQHHFLEFYPLFKFWTVFHIFFLFLFCFSAKSCVFTLFIFSRNLLNYTNETSLNSLCQISLM